VFKKQFIIHPFLYALSPVLFLYSYNIREVSFPQVLLPCAVILVFTALLLLLFQLIFHNLPKAGIIVSVILVLFFSYGHLLSKMQVWQIKIFHRPEHLFIAWCVILGFSIWLVGKKNLNLSVVTGIFNVVAVSLIAVSLLNIGFYKTKAFYGRKDSSANISLHHHDYKMNSSTPAAMHDIYYIILDAYASSAVLSEVYKYDNSEFVDYLRSKGFYVASHSRSNYATTFLSLASSLNVEYVNDVIDGLGSKSDERSVFFKMIENNYVMNFLKSKGYKFVCFGSGWEGTDASRHADVRFKYGWGNEFLMVLIQTTALDFFLGKPLIALDARQRILKTFSKLAEVPEIKGPKFVFAHIVCPHPPFLFDVNGEKASRTKLEMDGREWSDRRHYLGQLGFVNGKVKSMIEQIIDRSQTPPVIILQADHGTASLGRLEPPLTMTDDTKNIVKERLRIFNALYLPGSENTGLYDSLTPVNTFRIVFNTYFGTNFPMLEDRCYYSDYSCPYVLTDVTDEVGLGRTVDAPSSENSRN
jgi:hypothetical protein